LDASGNLAFIIMENKIKTNKITKYHGTSILVTNHNAEKIKTMIKYDDRFHIFRVNIKLKKEKKK